MLRLTALLLVLVFWVIVFLVSVGVVLASLGALLGMVISWFS